MDEQELLAKIADLELVSEYGSPVESAKAAQELAKCQNQLAKMKGFDNWFEYKNSVGMDSDATSYGRPKVSGGLESSVKRPFKPTPQGIYSDEDVSDVADVPVGGVSNLDVAKQEVFGNTHHSLNYCDALRTMGYSESRIKAMCKEEGIKYDSPMFNVEKPKATKKNVIAKRPDPVQKPNNTIRRIWN